MLPGGIISFLVAFGLKGKHTETSDLTARLIAADLFDKLISQSGLDRCRTAADRNQQPEN